MNEMERIYRNLWKRGYRPCVARPKPLVNPVRATLGLLPFREFGFWAKP